MTTTKVYSLDYTGSPSIISGNIYVLADGRVLGYNGNDAHLEESNALVDKSVIDNRVISHTDPTGNKFVDFQVAPQHMIFLNNKGEVFGIGKNRSGVLGGSKVEAFVEPKKIETPNNEKVLKIAVANTNTHILTDKGHIYSLGTNKWGQLGMEATSERVKWVQPNNLPEGNKFTDLIVGPGKVDGYHVYAKTAKGEVGIFTNKGVDLYDTAEAVDSIRSKSTPVAVPLKDAEVFPTSGNVYVVKNNTLYNAVFPPSSSVNKKITMTERLKLPGITNIDSGIISTKDGNLKGMIRTMVSKGMGLPEFLGWHSEDVKVTQDPKTSPDDAYKSVCDKLTSHPKEFLGMYGGNKKQIAVGMGGAAYILISQGAIVTPGRPESVKYMLDVPATFSVAAVTNTFLEYDEDFISGIMRKGC